MSKDECSGCTAAVIVISIYAGLITVLLIGAVIILYKRRKNSKNDRGNKNLNTVEGGRANQGIELSSEINQTIENRAQRNLRNDLEAQKRNRENALPINEVNTNAFVQPSRAPSKQTIGTTRDDVNVQAWNIPSLSSNAQIENNVPSIDGQSSSKPTVEIMRDRKGSFQSVNSSSSSSSSESEHTVYNDVLEATPKNKKKAKEAEANTISLNKKRLASEASVKSADFFDVEEYNSGSRTSSCSSKHDSTRLKAHLEKQQRPQQAILSFETNVNKHTVPSAKHSRSSSSSSSASSHSSKRLVYNDVSNLRKFDNINLVEDKVPIQKENAIQKKKAAPPPPISKTNTYTIMPSAKGPTPTFDGTANLNFNNKMDKKTKRSSESSRSSSESSPELRKKKESIEKDRQEVRSSIQAAPESYRKVSSYIEAKSSYDPSQIMNGIKKYDDLDEASSTSSKSSIEATPITPATTTSSDFRQHIEGIFDDFCVTPKNDSKDSNNKNREILPRKSSFSSDDDEIEVNEKNSSYNHGTVDIIDDHTLEKLDNEMLDQSKTLSSIEPRNRSDSVSSNSSSSSSSTSQSEFSLNQLPSATKVERENKPPVPQKPDHLINRSRKAKLDNSFSSNGMDVNVYRMVEGSPILNHKMSSSPQEHPEPIAKTFSLNKNEYETETDSEIEKENLRQALQRTSSSSSLSSHSSASSSSSRVKPQETKERLQPFNGSNQENNMHDNAIVSNPASHNKGPIFPSKSNEGLNAWNRPPLQTQHNMEKEEYTTSPDSNGIVKQCVRVNEDSYSSSGSTSSEDDPSEDDSVSSAKMGYNAKPPSQSVLPNFITIGRTTSIDGNQNTSSYETKGKINGKLVRKDDSVDSSASSTDSSSSSSVSSGHKTNDIIQTSALPPTALTNDKNSIPSAQYSKSLDSSAPAKVPKVNNMFIRSLNSNYNSVYVSLRDNDAMSKANQKDSEDLRSNLKAQIII